MNLNASLLMSAAATAAEKIGSWSDAKRDYAHRVSNSARTQENNRQDTQAQDPKQD